MDVATLAVSLSLLVFSILLVIGHLRTRRGDIARLATDSRQARFAQSRFRRRMQASVMIGITGIAILAGQWLANDPLLFACYWLAVVLWVLWICALAVGDMVATQHHFSQTQHDDLIEKAKLEAQLRRHDHEGNGRGTAE